MLFPSTFIFVPVMMSALAATVSAGPIALSQLGSLACNVARLKTVTGIEATSAALNHIPISGNSTVATAVSDAKAGVATSEAGVTTILNALISGQGAPDDARNQVGDGFTQTLQALQSIASSGGSTGKAVKKALAKLQQAIDGGNDVVAQCGSGSSPSASISGSVVGATGTPIVTAASNTSEAAPTAAS